MTNNKIYIDSIGIVISLTCRDNNYNLITFDVGDAAIIIVKRPDGYEFEWVASINGSVISYTTIDDDLEVAGDYIYQARIEKASGAVIYSETQKFTVYKHYE